VPSSILLQAVWGRDQSRRYDAVRVTVHRLRRNLQDVRPRDILGRVPGWGFIPRMADPK
jgi:DNA-binding response OmpR family regulator